MITSWTIIVLVASVSRATTHSEDWQVSPPPTPSDIMVDTINKLGLNILKIHNINNDNNIALSPYGVASILTALLEGVRGRAALEIQQCGGFPADKDIVRVGLRDIHRLLRSYFIPQEGFLSGLSLSSEKVTLKPEYQSILRFYGFDLTAFNTPIYPNISTTTPGNNITTESVTETTTNVVTMETTTEQQRIETTVQPTSPETTTIESTTTTTMMPITSTEMAVTDKTTMVETIQPDTSDTKTMGMVDTTTPIGETTMMTPVATDTTMAPTEIQQVETTTGMVVETTSTAIETTSALEMTTGMPEKMTELVETITTSSESTATTMATESATTGAEMTTEVAATETTTEMAETTVAEKRKRSTFMDDFTATEPYQSSTTEATTRTAETVAATTETTEMTSGTVEPLTTTTVMMTEIPEITTGTTETVTATTEGLAEMVETSTATTEMVTEDNEPDIEPKKRSLFDHLITTMKPPTLTTMKNENLTESSTSKSEKILIDRKRRSVVDYFIARYYDIDSESDHGTFMPNGPENKFSFLVNSKFKEPHVNFMTYDAVLPFLYIHSLNSLAMKFPLDSPKYYLLLILPIDENGIDSLICDIGKSISLKQIVANMRPTYVKAIIPSFMLRGFVILTSSLQKIGIREIFEPRHSDFSPMTEDKEIYVTNIEQAITVTIKNYMDGNMIDKSRSHYQYGPVEFKATHPFLYFVMDSEIDVTLVSGKIVNPINSRIQ